MLPAASFTFDLPRSSSFDVRPSAFGLLATLLLATSALAGNPVDRNTKQKKESDGQAIFVTGSLIPQRIKLKRIGTTTVSPIRIIDQSDIEQAGRRTTQGALITDPSVRVIGH